MIGSEKSHDHQVKRKQNPFLPPCQESLQFFILVLLFLIKCEINIFTIIITQYLKKAIYLQVYINNI